VVKQGGIEQRKHPRVENNVPVKISAPQADVVTETKNISCSGVYCRVNKFLEPMTKLQITLLLPVKRAAKISTRKITCGGVVVRTENIPGEDFFNSAIFFNDIHPRDSRVLVHFVDSLLIGKDVAAATPTRH
jgi:hypothetical protein